MTNPAPLNHTAGQTPERCPKCEALNPKGLKVCPSCGIIFQRYFQAQTRTRTRPVKKQPRLYGSAGLRELGQYAQFFRRLGKLLGAGGNLNQSLKGAAGSGSPGLLVQRAEPFLNQGHGLIKSLEMSGATLPAYVWAHLEAGDACGRLPEFLKDLANEMSARRKRILSEIFNFRMLWFFFMLLCASFSLSITTAVSKVSEEEVNRGVDSVLKSIATGAAPRFVVWAFVFTSACLFFAWLQIKGKAMLTRHSAGFERFRLQLPFFGKILIEDALSRYLILLARMLDAGLTLPRSLSLASRDIEYPHWRESFKQIRHTVERGETLAVGFSKTPHIPADMISELKVGESTGGLPDGMEHAANWLKESVDRKRVTVRVIFSAMLFIFSALLTLAVVIKGMGSWMPLLDF